MAREQTISWILVPNGNVAGTKLRFALVVAPRLKTDEAGGEFRDLDNWPDFLDWPNKIAAANFEIVFEGLAPVKATVVSAAPSKDHWAHLFKTDTPVRPFEFKRFDQKKFYTNAHFAISNILRKLYTYFGQNHGDEFPSVENLIGDTNQPNFRPYNLDPSDVIPALEERLSVVMDDHNAVAPGDFNDPQMDIYQNHRSLQPTTPGADPNAPVELKRPDFHELLSYMADYSTVRRKLGLVIDLEIDKADVPTGTPDVGNVYVTPTWTPETTGPQGVPANEDFTPRTKYHLDNIGGTFMPEPLTPSAQINDGMLILDKDDFQVVQIDPDGGTERAAGFAANLFRRGRHTTTDTPTEYAVPATRTQGLSLVEEFQVWKIIQKTVRDWVHEQYLESSQAASVILFAEDLVQGYVVDVHAKPPSGSSGAWYSLCQRNGTYEFPNDASLKFQRDDDAFISAAGFGSANDPNDAELTYSESRFLWQGWSLAAEPPGLTLGTDPDTIDTPVPSANEPGDDFKMKVTHAAKPGSLPRLRFGWTYRFRLRAMYISGDARPGPKDSAYPADFTSATNPITYQQFEPVPSPTLIYGTEKKVGEDLERLLIRSPDKSPTDPGVENSIRWVAPPKAGQQRCEQHGKFDTDSGDPDPAAYAMIIKRESGSFMPNPTPHDPNNPPDPDKVFAVDLLDFEVEVLNAQLPYLADPLARGASFNAPPDPPFKAERFETLRGLPPGVSNPVSFGDKADWPNLEPFRLMLVEGALGSSWVAPVASTSSGLLTVSLPKGERVRLRLSSAINPDDKDLLGLWGWMSFDLATTNPTLLTFLVQLVENARHYMVTPYRELLLIHAVKQPLQDPVFKGLTHRVRGLGDTFAELVCGTGLNVHAQTTSKIYIRARWDEDIDPLEEDNPRTVMDVRADPFELPVTYLGNPKEAIMTAADVALAPEKFRHEFGDTKHRQVTYTAEAVSRDAEYFRDEKQVTLNGTTSSVVDTDGIVDESETVREKPDKDVTYERDRDYTIDYANGEITRIDRPAGGIGDGDTVQVSYIPKPITRTSPEATIDIKNAARPAAPKVLYVVPTFQWQDSTGPATDQVTSNRRGGGLRVYLDRPWFSSGDGELLGVVLHTSQTGELPEQRKPYVTQWGSDPIWEQESSADPLGSFRPPPSAFTNTVDSRGGLTLDEVGGDFFVAGHAVEFDKKRKLWYCDIDMDIRVGLSVSEPFTDPVAWKITGPPHSAYYPFVQLALARYQPISEDDAHLSRVALADFIQLTPDRTVSMVKVSNVSVEIAVSGPMPVHDGIFGSGLLGDGYIADTAQGANRMTVAVEELVGAAQDALPEKPGEEKGWRVVGSPVELGFLETYFFEPYAVWSGAVTVPDLSTHPNALRLVVREVEQYTDNISPPTSYSESRIVFADTIALTPP